MSCRSIKRIREILADLTHGNRCNDVCPGWIVSDTGSRLAIQRCDECHEYRRKLSPRLPTVSDADCARLPEAKEELLRTVARRAGMADGTGAGSWVIDGNTTVETCRYLLRGVDDCDPAVLDYLPFLKWSEYWPRIPETLREEGFPATESNRAIWWDEYAPAFGTAMESEAARAARERLGEEDV